MISVSAATRIYLAVQPVDLRGSFNALSALVKHRLEEDPLSGQLYCFTNRKRNRLKVLFWDGSGLWICAKRLERGRLAWPQDSAVSCALRPEEWSNLVHGLEVVSRSGWYRK